MVILSTTFSTVYNLDFTNILNNFKIKIHSLHLLKYTQTCNVFEVITFNSTTLHYKSKRD